MFRYVFALIALLTPTLAHAAGPLVFAAASLTDVLNVVAEVYEKTGQPKPVFSFASSATLARQIENRAPADIFISADEQWMDYIATRNLIEPASRVALLSNRIVLVSTATNPIVLTIEPGFALGKALGAGKLALADPDSVPAGRYAKAALENLGVWREIEPRVVRAENVRGALAFVERADARAGVVYATDAALAKNITIVGTFPEISHPPITYPIALLRQKPSAEAKSFYDFMRSDTAKEIYQRFGFIVK